MQIELPLIAALTSFAGTWLAAHLAFSRFAREKVWERKAAAYTAIFEAIHLIGRWYEKHYEAALERREIADTRREQLQADATRAEDDLERRLAAETWLIPKVCRERLEQMTQDLKKAQPHNPSDWQGYLDESTFVIQRAVDALRPMVESDLKIGRRWYDRF